MSDSCSILDLVTGGSLLPHVYCTKVVVENSSLVPGKVDVTLHLELLQSKAGLQNSTWLNNLGNQETGNFMDSMYLQIVAVKNKKENVLRLLPSNGMGSNFDIDLFNDPDPMLFPPNVYVAKNKYGDNYLPRYSDPNNYNYTNDSILRGHRVFEPVDDSNFVVHREVPIQISNSSLLGNLTGADILLEYEREGKVREKIINGKPYYVIPFEYKVAGFNTSEIEELDPDYPGPDPGLTGGRNLGFLFYTYLDAATWLQESSIEIDTDFFSNYFEQFIVEGPVNTEVVFLDGKVPQYREAFFLPSGVAWEGSVHLHLCGQNEAPDGYCGDGGLSGLTTASALRGWMAGDQHLPGQSQPKLRLARVANNKVSDFRSTLLTGVPDEAYGLGWHVDVGAEYVGTAGLGPNYKNVAFIEDILDTAFFKENKKYGAHKLQSNPELSHDGGLVVYENDSEFSKLYVSRDKENNARGMFFIDFLSLLRNDSNLYPLFPDTAHERAPGILNSSKILELKLYRDRIKEKAVGGMYERYENDEEYEEPSQLVATLSDQSGWKSASQSTECAEIDLGLDNKWYTRYFMFTDIDVGTKSAGLYQYRIELKFLDGTYKHLNDVLVNIRRELMILRDYYEFSTLSYPKQLGSLSWNAGITGEMYNKMKLTPYFSDGTFDTQFSLDIGAHEILGAYKPWLYSPTVLSAVEQLFGLSQSAREKLLTMVSPISGSPQGILFFIKTLETLARRLEALLGGTTVNRSGSELDNISIPADERAAGISQAYSYNSMLDVVVSPSDSMIEEYHTFDAPAELFRALNNEDAYIDYLDLGDTLVKTFDGLRSVSPSYYKDRCMLEASKFSPWASTVNGFNNTNIHPAQGVNSQNQDTFANTGYSYLTPSIIEVSDPTDQNQSFDYRYQVFNGSVSRNYVKASSLEDSANNLHVLHHDEFNNLDNYDSLFVSILNYNIGGEDLQSADLSSYRHDFKDKTSTENDRAFRREPYKRLFEQIGLTLHDSNKHDDFFAKEPNDLDLSQQVPEAGFEETFSSDFSDGTVRIKPLLMDYLASQKGLLDLPRLPSQAAGNAAPYREDLPLAFKFREISTWLVGTSYAALGSVKQPMFSTAYTNEYETKRRGFFFANQSLTAKIEYYKGPSWDSSLKKRPLKFDDDSWQLLTEQALNDLDGKKLFCRIAPYDMGLISGATLPILDQYFLLYYGGDSPLIPPMPPAPQEMAHGDTPMIIDFGHPPGHRPPPSLSPPPPPPPPSPGAPKEVYEPEPDHPRDPHAVPNIGTMPGGAFGSDQKSTRDRLPEVKLTPSTRNTVATSILTGESTPGMSARDRISLAADLLAKRATKVPGASVGAPQAPEVEVVAEPTPTADLDSAIDAGLTDQMSVIEILQQQLSTADAGPLAVIGNEDLTAVLTESGADGDNQAVAGSPGLLDGEAFAAAAFTGQMSVLDIMNMVLEQEPASPSEQPTGGQVALAMAIDENVEEPLSSSNSGDAAVEILEGGTGNGLSEEEQIDAAVEVLITGQSTSDAVEGALEEETGVTIQDLIAQALAAAQAIAAANDDDTAAQQLAAVDEHAPPPPEEEEEDEEPEVVISMPYMGGGPLGH